MKIRNYILTIFFSIISILNGYATLQIPDLLIYNGDTLSFFATPLELLYQDKTERPNFFGNEPSSNCWRGYQAEWIIINGQLYLSNIYSDNYKVDSIKANLKELFPENYSNGKVKADWITSNSISLSDRIFTTFENHPTLENKDLGFEFQKGRIVEIFKCSDKTKQIIDEIYCNINWKILQNENDTIKITVQVSANINGVIESINVLKGYSEIYDNEAIRAIEMISGKKIFYRNLTLPIIFSSEKREEYTN